MNVSIHAVERSYLGCCDVSPFEIVIQCLKKKTRAIKYCSLLFPC